MPGWLKRKKLDWMEMQYRITNDKFDLIYQWDDLFGIVILYKDSDKVEEVISYLENVFSF